MLLEYGNIVCPLRPSIKVVGVLELGELFLFCSFIYRLVCSHLLLRWIFGIGSVIHDFNISFCPWIFKFRFAICLFCCAIELLYQFLKKLFWHVILMDWFDLKLVTEFVGSSSSLSVVEWVEEAKLISRLCKQSFLWVCGGGGIYAVY